MTRFQIGSRVIGDGAPVLIVAELSANHGGRIEHARDTIRMAAKAGVDAVKLQTYTPEILTLQSSAPPFVVRTDNEWTGRTLHDLYAEAMTPWEWHAELAAVAREEGLLLFSTPFDPTAVAFLEELDVPCHKIASFELVDLPLIEHVARTGKPLILSTGMASLPEIEAALRVCREAGNDRIAVLRCVSAYPARSEDMNLMSIDVLRTLGVVVGLSDHTRDSVVAAAAVARGAKIVEKHVTLARSLGGPDSFFSLEPDELAELVRVIRQTESTLGTVHFGPSKSERPSLAFRRSLLVARDVSRGAILTCDDVRSVRPSHGLDPRHLPEILGRPTTRDLALGEAVDLQAIGPAPACCEVRPATAADSALLLSWRNDSVTRTMSVSTGEVSAEEHATWLANTLASDARKLFVAVRNGSSVGQVRIDRIGAGSWEVSLTVAPEHRGKGLASLVLRGVEEEARRAGALRLCARLRPENEASARAFRRAGYYAFVRRKSSNGTFIECERRLVSY